MWKLDRFMDILLFTTRLCIIACRHMVPYYYNNEYIKASDIADVYDFKIRSLSPAFTALTKVGILESRVGGRDRGFIFARDPKEITLYDIVRALEGEEVVECCANLVKCKPLKCEKCSIYAELKSVIETRKKILSSKTIFKHYEEMKLI